VPEKRISRKKAENYMDLATPFNKILLLFAESFYFAPYGKKNEKTAYPPATCTQRTVLTPYLQATGLDMITALNTHCLLSN
jgi:hypothetical protein